MTVANVSQTPPLDEGIHHFVDHQRYHDDPCVEPALSSHIAKIIMEQSMLHAWHAHPRLGHGEQRAPTDAMDRGTLIDSLLFGVGPPVAVFDFDSWRKKEAQDARDNARADGAIPVLKATYDHHAEAAERIRERLKAEGIELIGDSQVTVVWRSSSVLCRGRLDHLIIDQGLIIDGKTCVSAAPRKCQRSMIDYGADIQHAAYVEAIETLHPELAGRVKMRFVYAEFEPPYAISVITPTGSMRELGARKWRRAVRLWGDALRENQWPGYGAHDIEAPAWALAQEMDDQITRMENDNGTVPF